MKETQSPFINDQTSAPWTVADAKAQLSEVLRRARSDGPQVIGTKAPCVVIPLEDWTAMTAPRVPLGRWLTTRLAGLGPLDLPPRDQDGDRPLPFADEDAAQTP